MNMNWFRKLLPVLLIATLGLLGCTRNDPGALPAVLTDYADAHSISYDAYPASLVELLQRNPETEEFVLHYPDHEDVTPDLSSFDPSEGVPLFLQWDMQWGYERYGSNVLALTGCGPTCLAMVGYYLTGDSRFSPDQIARFSEQNGFYSWGNGSKWSLISEGSGMLGLTATELPLDKGTMEQELEAGNPIICVVGPGDFTTEGHFIVLTGVAEGQFTVNDPNSRIKSQRLWSYETLEPQIRNLWAIGKMD